MKYPVDSKLNQFLVIGTNFTKADTHTRSLFAITPFIVERVYQRARAIGITDFFILSTCNRTEFYASGTTHAIIDLIKNQLKLQDDDFEKYFYVRQGIHAVRHLFRVAAGLDSQIVGDYEIVGQMKSAVQQARAFKMIDTLTDRITGLAFQASKEVKTKTNLSNGKYSVSFAATELIAEHHPAESAVKILLVGVGKFGETVAHSVKENFPNCELTLCNRTEERSVVLAQKIGASVLPFGNFTDHLHQFDVVVTVAQCDRYLIEPEHARGSSVIFLDLGIPQVINPAIKLLPGGILYSVDDVSVFHNNLMKHRYLEIPKAELILEDFIAQLMQWQNIFFRRDVLSSYKTHAESFVLSRQGESNTVEKVFSNLMQHIRENGYQGCHLIKEFSEVTSVEK